MNVRSQGASWLLCWMFCTVVTFAQQPSSDASPNNLQSDYANVYIYRLDKGVVFGNLFLRTRPIYFGQEDGLKSKLRKVAGLRDKHYLLMRLPGGKYSFDTRLMPGKLTLDLKIGQSYYLYLDSGNEFDSTDPYEIFKPESEKCHSRSASLKLIDNEQGSYEITELSPIKAKDIKDKKLVTIP